MSKRPLQFAASAGFLLAAVGLASPSGAAEVDSPVCATGDVKGAYAYNFHGHYGQEPGVSLGQFIFDGKGVVTGNGHTTIAGHTVFYEGSSGTYRINKDCSGELQLPEGTIILLQVLESGRELMLSVKDPTHKLTVVGEAKRIK